MSIWARIDHAHGAATSTGRNITQNARAPAPSERAAAAAIEKAPYDGHARCDRQQREAAEAVDAVHEHLREPLLVGPGRAEPIDRELVVRREPVVDDLAPGHEVEPAVVDEERRREDQEEDEAEAGEEDDEDVLLFGDPPEPSPSYG